MTEVTFHGGVGEIGGNIVDVETGEARFLLDFGKNFAAEGRFFSEFLTPRKSQGMADFLELGLLPDLDGLYRRDYLQHLGETPAAEPAFDALFLTHAHMDHVGYVHFLRRDIPVYCTPTTATMLDVVQDTGSYTFDEFVRTKTAFHLREKANSAELTRFDRDIKSLDRSVYRERDVRTLADGEAATLGDATVTCYRVNHSLPGAAGFHVETPDARLVYTGDLRLHGYGSHHTERFLEVSAAFDPDVLVTEGTNVGSDDDIPPEREVSETLADHLAATDGAAFINHPRLDLERLRSALRAARATDRAFVLRTWQAYMLARLEEDGLLPWDDLSLSSPDIRVLAPQKGWGTLVHRFRTPAGEWKRLDEIDMPAGNREDLVGRDYRHGWERDLVLRDDAVTPHDIRDSLEEYLVFVDYYRLKDLVDFQPDGGAYLWSRTEPFNVEMELDLERVHNWLDHFGLEMRRAHASGHMSHADVAEMVRTIDPDTLLPIHTEEPGWFRRFDCDQPTIRVGESISL